MFAGNYLGTSTIHLWASYELNNVVVIPGNCVAGQYGLTAPGPCSSRNNYDARRAFTCRIRSRRRQLGLVAMLDDGATSNYNGLLLSVQHRRTNGLTMQGNYTWSHCIGDFEETQLGIPTSYAYPGQAVVLPRKLQPGSRQNMNLSTVYEMPNFSNRADDRGGRMEGFRNCPASDG